MADCILVVNAGSSSVKFALFNLSSDSSVANLKGQISGIGRSSCFVAEDANGAELQVSEISSDIGNHNEAFEVLLNWLSARGEPLIGAGHRVVHGGTEYGEPVLIDEKVLGDLHALEALAPHHQPHNLSAVRALSANHPDLPQVACFDTAFHATQPSEASQLGLPREYAKRGMRRYGFHGLSYESVLASFHSVTGERLPSRLVIAHLGNGASMCAVKEGRCIATTMGFSTLDGIPMGTRSGAMDPGVLLHMMREDGASLTELEDILYNRSGLLGISGISSDMQKLLLSEKDEAREAVNFFCYRISRELGSLAAALGGVDALVFTGGIGENSPVVRAKVLQLSKWIGLQLDQEANIGGNFRITTEESTVSAWVVPTDEELTIAHHTRQVLAL